MRLLLLTYIFGCDADSKTVCCVVCVRMYVMCLLGAGCAALRTSITSLCMCVHVGEETATAARRESVVSTAAHTLLNLHC